MRIFFHDYGGYPFVLQLSRSLAARGHEVLQTYSASFQSPHENHVRREDDGETFDVRGIQLDEPFEKYSYLKRRRQEKEFGGLVAREIEAFAPDVVVSSNTPLEAQRMMVRACRRLDISFVFWVQDIHSVAIRRILREKVPLLGDAVGWFYEKVEGALLRKSDGVILIAEDFRPLLRSWGVDRARIDVIENWAPLEGLEPQEKDNAWAREHGLAEKFCFLYTGTLGMKHDPGQFVRLAKHFRDNDAVRVVVISEGPGAEAVKERALEERLDNLIVLDYQPYEEFSQVLATGDVLLAALTADAGAFSVPSKVLSYFCCERPVLVVVPEENLAAKIVRRHKCGLAVSPGDEPAYLGAAERLVEDEGLRAELGRNGRKYAVEHFAIDPITDRFEAVLKRSMEARTGRSR